MMSEKEIEYFNAELEAQNMQIIERPEYRLVSTGYPGKYSLRFDHNGIPMQSEAVHTVREWSFLLGIEIGRFLITIAN